MIIFHPLLDFHNAVLYYDTSKLDRYYVFNDHNEEDLAVGVREGVEEDTNKRNKNDFVLWFTKSKFEDQALKWDSPWGVGYPGWHIECSGISMKYNGEYPACEHKGNKTDRYVPLEDQPGQHMHDILCEICGEKAGQSTVEPCVKGKDGRCVCGYRFCNHTNQKTTYTSNDNGTHEVIVTCEACKQQLSKTTGNCVKGADGTCEKCGYMFPPDAPELKDGFYQITKEAELKWFRNEINKGNHTIKGKLLDNITLTDAWTPIGTSESHFVGSFDGNGKTISGLHFDVQNTPEESLYLGLFGYVGGNQDSAAEIRDLTVSGEIRVAARAARSVLAGGVVAYLDNHSKLSGVVSTKKCKITVDK